MNKLHLFDLKKWVLLTGVGSLWFLICKLINIFFRKTFPHFFAYAQAIAFRYKLRKLEKKNGRFDLIVFRGQGTFGQIWPFKDDRFVFMFKIQWFFTCSISTEKKNVLLFVINNHHKHAIKMV